MRHTHQIQSCDAVARGVSGAATCAGVATALWLASVIASCATGPRVCRPTAAPASVDESTFHIWNDLRVEPVRRPCRQLIYEGETSGEPISEARFRHDERGRLVEVRRFTRGQPATGRRYFHTADDRLLREEMDVDGDGVYEIRKRYEYDPDGRLAAELQENPAGTPELVRRYRYDARGNLERRESVHGGRTRSYVEFTYDVRGNAIRERWHVVGEDEPHTEVTQEYDTCDRLIELTSRDRAGRVEERSRSRYDRNGNLVREWAPGRHGLRHRYDDRGRLLETRHEVAGSPPTVTRYEYDSQGRRIAAKGDRGYTRYRYDERGDLVMKEDVSLGTLLHRSVTRWQYECSMRGPSSLDDNGVSAPRHHVQ